MHSTTGLRPPRGGLLATATLLASMPAAQAFELSDGREDWTVRFDNTLKFSYGQRVEGQNAKIANAANYNDGDHNFGVGSAVTQRVDLLTELDVLFQRKMGFRVSAASWYDHAYDHVGSNSNPFPGQEGNVGNLVAARQAGAIAPGDSLNGRTAQRHGLSRYSDRYYNGPSGEILDAFVFYSTEVGEESMFSAKLGRHNLFWGETLFNAANDINYGQSGLDLAKLYNVPGTETKELFLPRSQLSLSYTVNPELTLGAQYFLEFRNTRLPEGGTYMGGYDMFGEGGDVFWLPVPTALDGAGAFYATSRGHDLKPHSTGDFGLMARWSPAWLDGSLGFYYRKTTYNTYKLTYALDPKQLTTANHLAPDFVRWEKHRVWVVEGTLKSSARHIYHKRRMYLDEDSWIALASDQYDARGKLYRGSFAFLSQSYDKNIPDVTPFMIYDLIGGSYNINGVTGAYGGIHYTDTLSKAQWAPDALAGAGIR